MSDEQMGAILYAMAWLAAIILLTVTVVALSG